MEKKLENKKNRRNFNSWYSKVLASITLLGITTLGNSADWSIKRGYNKSVETTVAYDIKAREEHAYQTWKKACDDVGMEEFRRLQNDEKSTRTLEGKVSSGIDTDTSDTLQILQEIKYEQKPDNYAGELDENNSVKIIEKRGNVIEKVEGPASWYSVEDSGEETATGIKFKDNSKYVAVNQRLGYHLPCKLKLESTKTGKSMIVYGVDQGPFKFDSKGVAIKGKLGYIPHPTRVIDVSPYIAKELGFKNDGIGKVIIKYLGPLR